jgi:hypothetical protein
MPKNPRGEFLVNINIEISDDLHKKVKLASITHDLTLKDFVIKVLEKKSKECKAKI